MQKEWITKFIINVCESGVVCWDLEDLTNPVNPFAALSADSSPSRVQSNSIVVGEIRELYLEALLQVIFFKTVM
jgi:hypothetical protein